MIMDDVVEQIVTRYNLDIHNALDDAIVMARAHNLGETWEY